MKHLKKIQNPLVIAHRGAKSLAKVENTSEAFKIAMDLNVTMVEFDVRRTSDNELIIFHDKFYKRQKLSTLTYSELCNQTQLEGFTPPRLEDVLNECKDNIMLDIELKEAGYEEAVISLVTQFFKVEQFIITSFLDIVVKEIKNTHPDIRVGLLLGYEKASLMRRLSEIFPLKRLKASGADFVVPHFRLVTPMLVTSCKHHNYDVIVWTVNNDKIFNKLLKKHVAGIITDYPQKYVYN